MNLKFDTNNNVEPFTLILAHKNHKVYGAINNVSDFVFSDEMQPYKKISFTVNESIMGSNGKIKCNVWNDLKDFRYVYIPDIEEYFEIQVKFTDSDKKQKEIIGVFAPVQELNGVLRDIEINTEDDIARDEYIEPTKFFNPYKKECSLLHRVFEKARHYTITHVDESLWDIQRSFSIDGETIYDFCTGKLQEEIGCLFSFDSVRRTVSVYDIYNTCKDCGYRGEFIDTCSECGSNNVRVGYGEDTTIFISKENLIESVTLETNYSEIKNYLKVEGGDELIDATVMNCNPNGTAYIWEFSPEMIEDMSSELASKLESYTELCNEYADEYVEIMKDLYDAIDEELYLTSGMMPKFDLEETNASEQLALLNSVSLSPVAVSNINSLSLTTANSAVLGMAKVIVDSRFKVEIESSSLSSKRWIGKFKISNPSVETDVATSSSSINVTINDNYETFLKQKIKKLVNKEDSADLSNLLTITNYNTFVAELKKYCLNRLSAFYDAYQAVLDTLIEQGVANKSNYEDLYNDLYLPYYRKLNAIVQEIKLRESEINSVQNNISSLERRRDNIQVVLDFNTYIGELLLPEFYSFLKEDTYKNENYISDGLSNSELFKMAQELLSVAKKELHKTVNNRYSITANLNNLLKIKNFRPLLSHFKCGNYIRIEVDGVIYKLRLISYELEFSDSNSDINVTFSDISKINDLSAETRSILEQAKSMSGSFSYVTKQANKGSEAKNSIDEMRYKGLMASNTMVKNATTEDVVFGNTGILCRNYNDITGGYDLTQLKIIHNSINITDDGWLTSRLAIGENIIDGVKYFGMFADFVNAGKVWGSEIIGGTITGATFNNGNGTFMVDENGKLTATNATISGTITGSAFVGGYVYLYNSDTGLSAEINPLEQDFNGHNDDYVFNIQKSGDVVLGVTKDGDGYLKGHIEADSGHIGSFTIEDGKLYSRNNSPYEYPYMTVINDYTSGSCKYNYSTGFTHRGIEVYKEIKCSGNSLTYEAVNSTFSYIYLEELLKLEPDKLFYKGRFSNSSYDSGSFVDSYIYFKPYVFPTGNLTGSLTLSSSLLFLDGFSVVVGGENNPSATLSIGDYSNNKGSLLANEIKTNYTCAKDFYIWTGFGNASGYYSIKDKLNNLNDDINTLSSKLDSFESGSVIIYESYTKYSVTVNSKSHLSVNMGSFSKPSGYTLLGICPVQNGAGDQWQVTYAVHGNYIYAMVYNYFESSVTNDLACRAIFIKN